MEMILKSAPLELSSARVIQPPQYVVRHGHSLGQVSVENYRIYGDQNLPLTETGHTQSRAAGILLAEFTAAHDGIELPLHIRFSKCVRTNETATDIARVLESAGRRVVLIPDERLDKQRFGLFDGLFTNAERDAKYPELNAIYNEQVRRLGQFYARPPAGQSIADISDQAEEMLREVEHDSAISIFVTHGLNALCIERLRLGHDEDWVLQRQDQVENCTVRRIETGQDSTRARTLCLDTLN